MATISHILIGLLEDARHLQVPAKHKRFHHYKLQCGLIGIHHASGREGMIIHIEAGDQPDMTGAIAVAKAISKKIKVILVVAGRVNLVIYYLSPNGWAVYTGADE
jgi:hypothetical protein